MVRRLTLDEEILGSNPSRAAKEKQGLRSLLLFVLKDRFSATKGSEGSTSLLRMQEEYEAVTPV